MCSPSSQLRLSKHCSLYTISFFRKLFYKMISLDYSFHWLYQLSGNFSLFIDDVNSWIIIVLASCFFHNFCLFQNSCRNLCLFHFLSSSITKMFSSTPIQSFTPRKLLNFTFTSKTETVRNFNYKCPHSEFYLLSTIFISLVLLAQHPHHWDFQITDLHQLYSGFTSYLVLFNIISHFNTFTFFNPPLFLWPVHLQKKKRPQP